MVLLLCEKEHRQHEGVCKVSKRWEAKDTKDYESRNILGLTLLRFHSQVFDSLASSIIRSVKSVSCMPGARGGQAKPALDLLFTVALSR